MTDWSNDDTKKRTPEGAKAQQTDHKEDLTEYVKWHRAWGPQYCAHDVDQIEWRRVDDVFQPVAVLEMTGYRQDLPEGPDAGYLANVIARYYDRDVSGQKLMIMEVAKRIAVPLYIVLYRLDWSEFWVHQVGATATMAPAWNHHDRDGYAKACQRLGQGGTHASHADPNAD